VESGFGVRRPWRLLLLAVAAAMAVALSACGDDESAGGDPAAGSQAQGGTGKPEKPQIKFGILPTPDYAPVQIAIDRGFFEDEGLTVTAEIMAPGSAVPSVVGGSLDVAGINWISYILAVDSGIDLRAVAEADRGVPGYAEFLVPSDSDVEDLQDLVGKKVGVVATPGNCDVIPIAQLGAKVGGDTPNFVNLAIPDMPATIQRGGVASACVPEPTLTGAEAGGDFKSVFDLFSGEYEGFPIVGYSTSREFADANPNTIGAVRRALTKASTLINDDPDVVREILPTYTQIPADAAKTITLPTYPSEIDNQRLQDAADLMQQIGLVKQKIEIQVADPEAAGG
jgi:NitT/TauT family transport system substrate-binding protein